VIKNFFLSYWLWTFVLAFFIGIILWDEKIEEGVKKAYIKHRMILKDVHFSQVEGGFEHARMYADICDMDDNQNNMNATNIRTVFYKKEVATWTGILLADRGLKNPFEAKFWGNVHGWNSDNERFKTEELRYFFNRKELHTQKPITIWKDDAVLTGLGFRYNTQDKEAQVNQHVVIRIWEEKASGTIEAATRIDTGVPVAPPLSEILKPIRLNIASETALATQTPNIPGEKNP